MKLIKYAIVGGSGTVLGIALLYLFTSIIGWHYLVSNIIVFCIVVASNYTLNSVWTFGYFNGGMKYVLISLSTLGLRELLLYIFTDKLGIYYLISAIFTIVIAFLLNYTLSRRFVWARTN